MYKKKLRVARNLKMSLKLIILTCSAEIQLSTGNGSIKLRPALIIDSTPYILVAHLHTTFIRAGTIRGQTNHPIFTGRLCMQSNAILTCVYIL